jgi:hypothetical protein
MAERRNTDLFEVLIGQVWQDREIDMVLSKAVGILGQTKLLEPVRDVLHSNPPQIYPGLTALLDEGDGEFIRKIPRE